MKFTKTKKSCYFLCSLLVAAVVLSVMSCTRTPRTESLRINYEKYVMPNGLQVILHTDHSDPVISYAIMYHVGSSRETPGKTGFAHLFEHLLFGGSENVPAGTFDKIIEGVGGSNNGFTSRDVTTYFEIFPKNALEKVLWLESDRMGFFINSVTGRKLAIQQNVVQNEKRQGEDNSPYGFTDYVISKNLYPATHPYNWEVIGEMEDLQNATLDDVKSFYEKFYGPNNATLVLAGDFNPDSVKILLDKYFGEIRPHGEVTSRPADVPSLGKTVKLYHEDNFANVPEITLVWPVAPAYQKESYALDFLAKILADGKKAPLYKVLVKEKNLTSRATAFNNSQELAGEFTISIRANEGKNLAEIESAVNEAFERFEKEGITESDIERVKASSEKDFYEGIASVFRKSLQLAFYNTFLNDPGFIEKDIANIKAVTLSDVKAVYEKYIKGKPRVVTSFVPSGQAGMMAEGSVPAGVKEENIEEASQVEIAEEGEDNFEKTPSVFDRTKEPPLASDPEVNVPAIWNATLTNGIKVYGIENRELPLVDIGIAVGGGIYQDRIDLPGVASMVAGVMPQGTRTKTPEQLEEETELLGSDIRMSASPEEINLNISTLSRNFEKTLAIVREIILEPRWDSSEFALAKNRTRNRILQAEAQPNSVARNLFFRLAYGTGNILGYSSLGTKESIDMIKPQDLIDYYDRNFAPNVTRINIAGNVSKEQVLAALQPLGEGWKARNVVMNEYPLPAGPEKSKICFADMPGSRQSVIFIGYLALSRDNPDFVKLDFANYRLGGAFTSIFNQILREEKGYTYGAFSYIPAQKVPAPFIATANVRSDATFESLRIFRDEMEKYRSEITPDDLQFIKDCMLRSAALQFETNNALVGMLSTISKYGLPEDYIKRDQEVIRNMTIAEHQKITGKYIIPDRMYYVVVGDAATQLPGLARLGFGQPVLVK